MRAVHWVWIGLTHLTLTKTSFAALRPESLDLDDSLQAVTCTDICSQVKWHGMRATRPDCRCKDHKNGLKLRQNQDPVTESVESTAAAGGNDGLSSSTTSLDLPVSTSSSESGEGNSDGSATGAPAATETTFVAIGGLAPTTSPILLPNPTISADSVSTSAQSSRTTSGLTSSPTNATIVANSIANGHLSEGAEIGIGVGVGVGVLALAGVIMAFLLYRRRNASRRHPLDGAKYAAQPQSELSVAEETRAMAPYKQHTYTTAAPVAASVASGTTLGQYDNRYEPYSSAAYGGHHGQDDGAAVLGAGGVASRERQPPSPRSHSGRDALSPLRIPTQQQGDERTPLHSREPSPTRSVSPVSPVSPIDDDRNVRISRESSLRHA